MKLIGKFMAKKIASLVVLVLIALSLVFHFREQFFGGILTSKYSFVIKRFERENQLVVAGVDVETTAEQVFTNKHFKDWPEWTEPLTKALVGRDLVAEIPVKTEFKLELKGLDKSDLTITNSVLSFKKPLTVYVDSQATGVPVIKKSGSGLVDKAVDLFTSGQKAQEFLAEKSQEAIYETSEHVLDDLDRQKKVATFASQSLEQLLNLDRDDKLMVELTVDDLEFINVDKP
ncbi:MULTISPECIES: hypothetical protein [unclassified Streptococcus]|uniref:hypothetical protein n=1 Tax=unclassified Streptococcus TaxID=2608887 RepID=UPI00359DE559